MAIFTVEFLLHWLAECWTGSGCCGSLIGILKDTECELNWEFVVEELGKLQDCSAILRNEKIF